MTALSADSSRRRHPRRAGSAGAGIVREHTGTQSDVLDHLGSSTDFNVVHQGQYNSKPRGINSGNGIGTL